jgi:hypothetical protein
VALRGDGAGTGGCGREGQEQVKKRVGVIGLTMRRVSSNGEKKTNKQKTQKHDCIYTGD